MSLDNVARVVPRKNPDSQAGTLVHTTRGVNIEPDAVKEMIVREIKAGDPTSKDFVWELAATGLLDAIIYYVEWKSEEKKKDETLCYALVTKKMGVRLFDDGVAVCRFLQDQLERRRSFRERLNEFSLFEFVAAIIAVAVTSTVIYQVLTRQLTQEFVGIFGIVLGYYFGKTVTDKR